MRYVDIKGNDAAVQVKNHFCFTQSMRIENSKQATSISSSKKKAQLKAQVKYQSGAGANSSPSAMNSITASQLVNICHRMRARMSSKKVRLAPKAARIC